MATGTLKRSFHLEEADEESLRECREAGEHIFPQAAWDTPGSYYCEHCGCGLTVKEPLK